MRASGAGYCASFDGLRAIAILIVIAHHQELPGFEHGYYGVDLFFVLSGFLITTLIVTEHARTGQVRLRSFWLRRVLRLTPLYVLYVAILTIGYVCGWFNYGCWNGDHYDFGLPGGPRHLVDLWLYIRNLHGNPDAELNLAGIGVSGHLWSLALEEQFYLAWPFACMLMLRRDALGRRLFTPLLLGLQALALQLASTDVAEFHPWTRGASLTAGCVAALVPRWYPQTRRWLTHAAVVPVCVGAVVLGVALVTQLAPDHPEWFALPHVLPLLLWPLAVMCAALWHARTNLSSRVLAWSPLVYLGKISYGVYMWHMLCWALIARVMSPGAWTLSLATVSAVAVAMLSYHVYEQPFLRLKDRLSARARPAGPAALHPRS